MLQQPQSTLCREKGVSFLSRIIGAKKKDITPDDTDNASLSSEARPAGMDAEVFSQPIGFIPRFPAPPKYIRVRPQNTSQRDFDRVFLAQTLDDGDSMRKKKSIESRRSSITSTAAPPQPGNTHAIWAMEFSKDGKYLAAAGQDKVVRVWSIMSTQDERHAHEKQEEEKHPEDSGMKLNAPVFRKELVQEYAGHGSSVLDLSWSKNNFLLSSSMDKTVRLWHISRKECLCTFKHADFVTSIQFHPRDDRFFLAGSLDSTLRLWSIPDKHVAYSAKIQNMVTAVAFTPDGKYAIAGCYDGLCLIYETDKLSLHAQIHVRSARGKNAKGSKITGIETITLPKDDPAGEVKLLITSNDSRVRMYNFRDRQLEIKFRGNENTCSQIHATFSDDGRYVICGSEDRKVYIWPTGVIEKDVEKRPVHVFEAHSAIVTTAILAPTKTRLLLGQSADPIYDIVNPPPVTLADPRDSMPSSKAPTESGRSTKSHSESETKTREKPRKTEDTHTDGNIIITADYTGSIKVFRQDNAYEKRQQLSWDTQSTFSKKILGRSGSVATRASATSSHRRNSISRSSIILSKNNPTNDRILNWRNSIAGNPTASHETLRSRRMDPEDPLRLIGDTSMRYYDEATFERMAARKPRSPMPLIADDDPLERKQSLISQLSSEISSLNETSESLSEEEVCKKCGGKEFKIDVRKLPRKDNESESTDKRQVCISCGAVA
ncbi:putative wd repeat protein [Phaeomoniella chlamydospora]|uniref:Putative wd repeat protein n=1 Tax=Phaeomoniella chlamydospora TaxID=158046 RepID=A0A0G2EFD4_PHACM|nr:putative wd repeat protein [Phaeomoniella chlamydospora]